MRNTGPTPATRRLVYDRDTCCVRCGSVFDATLQHRIRRGMGGTRAPWVNGPANLLWLCGSGTTGCHGWTEHHPTQATWHGWAVPTWADLATWPVWHQLVGWALLDRDGQLIPWRPAADDCPGGCVTDCRTPNTVPAGAGVWLGQ